MKAEYDGRQSIMKFDGKPSAAIRDTLKSYSYRWSPAGMYWYCFKCSADKHIAATRAVELVEKGSHGTCQKCKAAPGRYRRMGWNEPEMLLCEKCCRHDQWHPAPDSLERSRIQSERLSAPDYSDTLYEDQCRNACGL